MTDAISAIEEVTSLKRRKKVLEAQGHVELANATPLWSGGLIQHDVQIKFIELIARNSKNFVDATLKNNRLNHEEKKRWVKEDRKKDYWKRLFMQTEQKNFSNRIVDKIQIP